MHGVGFLVHKESLTYVMGCKPISSRVITICLRAKPFKMTLIQAYAPTTDKSDAEVEEFYEQLQKAYDKVPKGDIVIVLGDWNSKVGTDTFEDWKEIQGPSCNSLSNERGQRLLEFASYNSFVLANTFGVHTKARTHTYHSPLGIPHQIDYILVPKRYRSSINTSKTHAFPGADCGSDHDLVLLSMRIKLKKVKKKPFTRMKFDLEKLNDPNIAKEFKAAIGGRFAPLLIYDDDKKLGRNDSIF